MSGKGSAPRPFSVKADVFSENFCMTFGHKYRASRCMNCGGSDVRSVPENQRQSRETDESIKARGH